MDRVLILIFLVIITFIDIKKLIIPNFLNLLLLIIIIYSKGIDFIIVEESLIGMGLYSLPLIFIYGYLSDFFKRDVLGFGDIKLIMSLGYFMGYTSFYKIYLFYILTFISASLVGIIIGIKRKNFRTTLAFSPFLILSFFIFEFLEII